MDSVEKLDLTALGGVDTITVDDMSGTDFRQAAVDLQGPAGGPDGAADLVTVNGSAGGDRIDVETDGPAVVAEGLQTKVRLTGSELADRLQVNTLDGNDDVDVDGAVFALIDIGRRSRPRPELTRTPHGVLDRSSLPGAPIRRVQPPVGGRRADRFSCPQDVEGEADRARTPTAATAAIHPAIVGRRDLEEEEVGDRADGERADPHHHQNDEQGDADAVERPGQLEQHPQAERDQREGGAALGGLDGQVEPALARTRTRTSSPPP